MLQDVNDYKKLKGQLEEKLLAKLSSSNKDLLEDEDLIVTLKQYKIATEEVN